jgi:hypothetical protein
MGLRVRKNLSGFLFYFFCFQFVMAPISVAGYALESVRRPALVAGSIVLG